MKKTKKSSQNSKLTRLKKKFSFAGSQKKILRGNSRLPLSLDRLHLARRLISQLLRTDSRVAANLRSRTKHLYRFLGVRRSIITVFARLNRASQLKNVHSSRVVVPSLVGKYRIRGGSPTPRRVSLALGRLPLRPLVRATSLSLLILQKSRVRSVTSARTQRLCWILAENRAALRALRSRRRRATRSSRRRPKIFWRRQKNFKKVINKIGRIRPKRQVGRKQNSYGKPPGSLFLTATMLGAMRTRQIRKKRRVMYRRRVRRWWWRAGIGIHCQRRRSRARFSYPNKRQRWRLLRRDPRLMKHERQRHLSETLVAAGLRAAGAQLSVRYAQTSKQLTALQSIAKDRRPITRVLRRRALRQLVRSTGLSSARSQTARLDTKSHHIQTLSRSCRVVRATSPIKSSLLPYIVRAKNYKFKVIKFNKTHRTRSYSQWQSGRSTSKLQLQRILRAGMSMSKTSSLGGYTAAARISSVKGIRNALLRKHHKHSDDATPRIGIQPVLQTAHLAKRFQRAHMCNQNVYAPSLSFLSRASHTRTQKQTVKEIQAEGLLSQQLKRYHAAQLVHRRSKLRLPGVSMTRTRRRRSGLVAFVRNSLKRPQTSRGRQQQFLPPVNARTVLKATYRRIQAANPNAFHAYEQREDTLPLFWKKPHNRANSKAINKIRRRRYGQYQRFYQSTKALAQFNASIPLGKAKSIVPQISARLQDLNNKSYNQPRTLKYALPVTSQTNTRNALLTSRQSRSVQRLHGLWQTRSVHAMLKNERGLSAWSPQISARNRRKHYPRVGAVSSPRRRLTFRARRIRNTDNATRLRRGIPQRRYTDHMRVKLQYLFGSVGSVGYTRLRRVHRAHSEHNRWWRPTKRGVPFAHPYSRRELNAIRYKKVSFSKVLQPATGGFAKVFDPIKIVSLHTKFPPRTIPWRNFHYRRPRYRDAPKTLQRWTFTPRAGKTSRIRPVCKKITIAQPLRTMRKILNAASGFGSYKNHRWGVLDAVTLNSNVSGQFYHAISCVPDSVWAALRDSAGSSAAYTVLRQKIFSNFRVQLHKFQVIRPSVSSHAAETAVQTLLALVRAVMANSRIALTVSATEKHLHLRETAFGARVERKALRHLKLRELPQAGIELNSDDLLRREQSKAYKRWLAGAEGMLKRHQLGYTPTSRSRYTDNVATNYGRQRVRFPASGRRRKSYDSLLHAFAKKVSSSRLRRTSKLRFQWARPQLSTNFQENVSALTPLFGSNRRQYLAQKLSSVAYLSPSMRELFAHRTAANSFGTIAKSLAISTKRRFISLPINCVFREHRRVLRKLHTPYKQAMYSIRAGILRRALRQRRKERAYIDLRQAIRQRRLPREKPKNYRKQQRKQNLRRRFAAKRGKYSRRSVRKRTKSSSRWTLRHLSAIGSRRGKKRKEKLPLVLPYGENVTIPWTTIRKRARAIRGFTHPVNRRSRRRLRRRVRDSSRRKRRARRGKVANRRRAKRRVSHWSEKRMRRLRKNSFSLRKNTIARIFSSKIVTKAKKRFSSMGGGRNVNFRLLRFFSRKTSNLYVPASRIPQEQPSFLVFTKSNTIRNHKYINWFIGKSRMSRRRSRVLQVSTPVLRRARIERALDVARNLAVSSVAKRLISATPHAPITTPLWFEAPVTHAIKSAAVKEQEAAAAVAAKEGSFRLPAQYVEGVTTLIPELINSMLSTRINNSDVSYATTKQTIRNIYWSLRVYLNVDPFDSRFFVRDKVPAARVRVFEEMTDLSVFQKTLQPDRAALRYRFQPSRLVRAKNTSRFREDWLRAFFPARHALYQENAEDYGKFLVATHRIRRLRIGPRGMGSWRTVANIGGLEIRARQLLKLRLSRRRSRFETVLQTTRRLAAEEPAPQMPTSTRESFFSRLFSTYSSRGLSLTSRWMHRQKRFVSLDAGWRSVSPVALNTVRNRLIPRLEARGKSRYITTDWAGITSSLLDGRFSRTKSPRSRQYLIRLPKQPIVHTESRITDILSYREVTARFIPQGTPLTNKWTRVRRGTWSHAFKQVMQLTNPREKYALRRVQDALFSRSDTVVAKKLKSLRPAVRSRLPKHRTTTVTYKRGMAIRSASIFGTRVFKRVRTTLGTFAARQTVSLNKKIRMGISVRPESRIFAKKFYLDGTDIRASRSNQKLGYFASSAGWQITRGADLARAAAMHTRVRRQAPFDNYRPYLWNKLTLRKMKKFRIGKYWIRDTSHWLRDPWLSKIVAPDMSLRRDQFGGELRSRSQQVGEYVADVDATGRDIPRSDAPKERHKFQKIMPEIEDTEINKTNRILKYGSIVSKTVALHRLQIASQARRKPVPSMRLANYEYRDVIREHKEEKAKSPKQRMEEEQARIAAYWLRKSKRLSPIRARRLPLKHPANLWLPHVIWKDIQRRVRKFDWRESDQVFARRGYRGAFRFRPTERRKAPWLEPLMYTRAAYSTRLKAFRRRQFPHEQKKFKWLQRVRKVLYPGKRRKYIKRRKWPQLKRYNQKLHYSLFNLRDRGAARTHFKRLNGRTRPTVSAFVSMSKGLTDRLDVTCLKMQFAPTIYWARIVSEFGLLRVNGVTIYNPSYRLKPADVIYPNWDVVARFQHYFQPYLSWRQLRRNRNKSSTAFYPTNMEYQPGIRAIVYKHAPDESDLRKRSRVHPTYLRWFKLDSV